MHKFRLATFSTGWRFCEHKSGPASGEQQLLVLPTSESRFQSQIHLTLLLRTRSMYLPSIFTKFDDELGVCERGLPRDPLPEFS
jgi:hypothetical protein